MRWQGYYVNLDSARSRRASIEKQLASAGMSPLYTRFAAIDGNRLLPKPGLSLAQLGCLRSHAEILALPHDDRFIHVLEDDAVLSSIFAPTLAAMIDAHAFDRYDLVFTDVMPGGWHHDVLRRLKPAYDAATARKEAPSFQTIDLKGLPFWGTNSYLVNPTAIKTVRGIVNSELMMARQPVAIDVLYGREINAGRLKAAVVFPFVSAVDLDLAADSSIVGKQLLPNDLLRHAFYVECNLPAVEAYAARARAGLRPDRHMDLLVEIERLWIASARVL